MFRPFCTTADILVIFRYYFAPELKFTSFTDPFPALTTHGINAVP